MMVATIWAKKSLQKNRVVPAVRVREAAVETMVIETTVTVAIPSENHLAVDRRTEIREEVREILSVVIMTLSVQFAVEARETVAIEVHAQKSHHSTRKYQRGTKRLKV